VSQQPSALPFKSRFFKHFRTTWYVLVQRFLNFKTGALDHPATIPDFESIRLVGAYRDKRKIHQSGRQAD
jgi:hypothetical protein